MRSYLTRLVISFLIAGLLVLLDATAFETVIAFFVVRACLAVENIDAK